MMAFQTEFVLLVILTIFNCLGVQSSQVCPSPQYLELGTTSTIQCVFDSQFFGILWYNTTDYINNDPILHYRNTLKSGPGYDSGEFDVHPNGSLIIRNVSLQHDNVFTVAYVHTRQEEPVILEIRAIVIVSAESTTFINMPSHSNNMMWALTAIVTLFILIFITLHKRRKHFYSFCISTNEYNQNHQEEEVITMLSANQQDVDRLFEMKEKFVKDMKERYEDLYDSLQPIPYIKDKMCGNGKRFIDISMEFLAQGEAGSKHEIWRRLKTYQDIFHDPRVKSTRRILEGGTGLGKSTLCVQMAYDWCTQTPYLQNVEIFILLPLGLLAGVSSIYKAIKVLLLPEDSLTTEEDIKNILEACKSVVVIFDGFDEYPDRDNTAVNGIMRVIEGKILLASDVIITTRSSVLPKRYNSSTKRVRLTTLDEDSRKDYIRMAVVGKEDEKVQKVEQGIKDNPVLNELCQIPIMFLIFSHITYEGEQFRELTSVTTLFRVMVGCLHSHSRNKLRLEHIGEYEIFETKHNKLDTLAFEALKGDYRSISWKENELCEKIGEKMYRWYIRIGILVKEEIIDSGTSNGEKMHYQTEVRFRHKLFCEWYAAHYLCERIIKDRGLNLKQFLEHLNPSDVQYLYRFACGINPTSGNKVITYLNDIDGGQEFGILCALEQTGKFDQIIKRIRELCTKGIIISGYEDILQQRSSIQLLKIAARNDINVQYVALESCVASATEKVDELILESELVFPIWIPVKTMHFSFSNKDISHDECQILLKFSSGISELKEIWFTDFVPPKQFPGFLDLPFLDKRGIQIFWQLFGDCPEYKLDLSSGEWQDCGTMEAITDSEYDEMVSKSRQQKTIIISSQRAEKVQRKRKQLRLTYILREL